MSILRFALFAVLVLLAAIVVVFINTNLAALAEFLHPGSLWPAHGVLLAVEALACFWFWKGIAGGRKHLLLLHDDNPQARERFARELARRLRSNPHVREAGIAPAGPEDTARIAQCMALLRAKADAEIQQTAKRVFLATALSQNGRLDALIVFVSLCRLVWRICILYNQRPHPRETASLYFAVLSSTFLALSLEELDLTTEISIGFGQAFHAIAPAGLSASIPFAGNTLQTFTASAIDGTVNCYLALRTGIIARNAYDYALAMQPRPSRAAVFREAGALLLAMSASLMDRLAAGFSEALMGVVKNAQDKTMQAGKDIVQGIGRAGTDMGACVGRAAAGAATSVAGAFAGAAASVVDTAGSAARSAIAATAGAAAKPFPRMRKKTTPPDP